MDQLPLPPRPVVLDSIQEVRQPIGTRSRPTTTNGTQATNTIPQDRNK